MRAIAIDHIVIAGRDLAQMMSAFADMGLSPEPGGVHADGQTHNALLGFADGSYLELIAPVPGGHIDNHPWAAFMAGDVGVCAWALRTDDIERDTAAARAAGVAVQPPKTGGRNRPDGVRLEWITARLGTEPQGSLFPFLIQDVTPRHLRTPRTASAEGLITGVTEVVIGLNADDHEVPALFSAVFGGHFAPFKDLPPHLTGAVRPQTMTNGGTVTFEYPNMRRGVNACLLQAADLDQVQQRIQAHPMHWRGLAGLWAKLDSPAIIGIL
jgi:hypothetical protein